MDTYEAAFAALIQRHRDALGRLCRHYEASAEARRDLEQEILLSLWTASEHFRGDCSERTFVYRVAHNVAATHVLRAVRDGKRRDEPAEPAVSTEATLEARSALARLEARLRLLDLGSQQLVLLALEGCSTAEMAAVTGLSTTNVTTRLSRARQALSEETSS